MSERSRASSELLEELGWMTVQWARLEAYVDLIAAYLCVHRDGAVAPKPFNARLKFVRQALREPLFINLKDEGTRLDQAIKILAERRNELVHHVVTQWSGSAGMEGVTLKSGASGYRARQGIQTELRDIQSFVLTIQMTSARLFGFLERLKSIIRLAKGEDDFWKLARLDGDRG